MPHSAPLISTLVFGLVLAFCCGLVAQRLRLPPLIGYLLAGIAIGPFSPGFVADQSVANQLAEIGVILLMFGVGLHFSFEDLLSVRAIAISGALAQALVATPLGMAVGWWQGWTPGAGLVFGIALSIASTVVLLRLLGCSSSRSACCSTRGSSSKRRPRCSPRSSSSWLPRRQPPTS